MNTDFRSLLLAVRARPNHIARFDTMALLEPDRPTVVMVSFDVGHHACGWWANADYERCWHLSITHVGEGIERVRLPPAHGGHIATRPKLETPSDAEVWAWAKTAWGENNARMSWTEPAAPPNDPYRLPNIVHVRLFVDRHDQPFMPLGEVYHIRPTVESPAKIVDGRLGADVK